MSTKKTVLTVISLILMFGFKYFPSIMGLNPIGMATLGVTIGTIIMLVGVNLVWPVFLAILAFAVNDVYTLNAAVTGTLGNSIFWFMMINGMVIGVIEKTGLLRRIALWLVCRDVAKKNPWIFLAIFFLAEAICGSLMNTTAVVLLFLALAAEICATVGIEKGSEFGAIFMLVTAAVANISHALTPFGHSITILSIGYFADLGDAAPTPNYVQYSAVGYIAMVIILVLVLAALKFYSRLDVSKISGFDPSVLKAGQGAMSSSEKIAAVLLVCIIAYWVSPAVLQTPFPTAYAWVSSKLGIICPLIVAMFVMCNVHIDGKPMMDIRESIRTAPWSAGLPVAISLYLGTAMSNADAGIADAISNTFGPVLGSLPGFVFVIIITLIVLVMTEFTSCTLSATVGLMISYAVISSGAVTGVNTMGLVIAIALTAQSAIATPPASGPAGILAGQGWISSGRQFKDGVVYNILMWIVALLAYFIMGALF